MIINTENKEKFFSFKGRIRRSTFGIRFVAFFIIMFFMYFLIGIGAIIGNRLDSSIILLLIPLILILCLIIFIVYIIQIVKRLHDLDKEGFWAILLVVPLVAYIFLLYLIFADGTVGPNQYGEDPKGRTPNTTQENKQQYM